MNSITERYVSFPKGIPSSTGPAVSPPETATINAGVLTPLAVKPLTSYQEKASRQSQEFQTPPAAQQNVGLRVAEAALNRILVAFGPKDPVTQKPMTLAEFERIPMEAMALAASLMGVQALGDSADLKSLALEIRTKGAENLRLRQNEELRQQIEKAIEDQKKAHKAGVFSAVVSWVVSVAEIASGVAKLAIGNYAGGAMDLAAGCAGLVKAMCETLALVDKDNAEKYKKIGDIAGKIQLGFEIAGMMVDVLSVGRGLMAAKCVPTAAENVMKGSVATTIENYLSHAVKEGGDVAIKQIGEQLFKDIAAEVGREVAQQTAKSVATTLAEQTTRFLGQGPLLQAFAKQAIETIVTKSVETVALQALKTGAQHTAEEITKAVVREIMKEIVQAAVKASLMSTENIAKATIRGSSEGVNTVFQGVVNHERADLKKIIGQLMAESMFMQFLFDEFENIKKRSKEDISKLLDGAGKSLEHASETQLKNGAMLSSIAANIA